MRTFRLLVVSNETVESHVLHDTIDRLEVLPEYKGESIVPSRIAMEASHSGREGSIATTIEVW